MKSLTTPNLFWVTVIVLTLSLARPSDGWPSTPDAAGGEEITADFPSQTDLEAAQEPPTPANTKLIGVAVVQGGPSYAIFQLGNRSVLVREGDEIVAGLQLRQVRWRSIDAERGGVLQEIYIGQGDGEAAARQTILGITDEGAQTLREKARKRVRFVTNLPERK